MLYKNKPDTHSRRIQFTKGVIVDFGSTILIILTGIIVTPLILSYLSDADYGFWMTIVQIIGVLSVMEMGTAVVVTQRSADSSLALNHEEFSRLMTACLLIQLLAVALILTGGLVLAKPLFSWFKIEVRSTPVFVPAYHLMLAWFSISLIFGLFPALLAGRQKIAQAHAITAMMLFISTVAVIPFLAFGASILAFPMAQWLAGFIGVIFVYFCVRRYVPPFSIRITAIRYKDIKDVFCFSFFNWLGKIAFIILSASDNIIIAGTLGPASVTPFLLTSRLNSLFAGNIAKLSSSSLAGFSELFAEHNYERLQSNTLGLFRLCARVAFFGSVVVVLFTERFVSLWVGPQYFVGTTFALLLGFLCFRDTIIKGIGIIIIASGDMRGFGLLTLIEAIVKIVLVILFILFFKLGLIGIVLGQLLATVLITGIYFPMKICQLTKLSVSKLLKDGFVVTFFKSAPSMAVLLLMPMIPEAWGWGGIALIGTAAFFCNILCFEVPAMLSPSDLSWRDRISCAVRANFP